MAQLVKANMITCRRMALAALHFPEARTLAVSEQDPFHGSAATAQAPCASAVAYDPAAVVAAAPAMLRRRWLDATAIVRGGWLPLLMRCLGSADEAIRHASAMLHLKWGKSYSADPLLLCVML